MFCALCKATEDLADVKRELGPFAQWRDLGLNLGLSPSRLEVIEEDYARANARLHEVLLHWLKRNYKVDRHGSPSWNRLAEAVEPISHALAIDIRENH